MRLASITAMQTRVLVADDHGLVRQGLRLLLEKDGFEVVGEAEDGLEAVRLARDTEPDVAILDLRMPQLNGIDAAREIHQCSPRTKTLLLTTRADDLLLQALAAGMRGCLLKTLGGRDLVQAIRQLEDGRVYLSPGLAEAVVQAYRSGAPRPADPLSLREREVLQLIAEGRGTKQIATVLCISTRTVESHRYRIMRKLAIHETAGLVRYAIGHGLSSV
jgi:DNA-binding NarL/FixJ family response regulator